MILPPPVSLTASKNNREPIPRLPDDTLSLLVFPREGHMHFQRTKRTTHSSVDATRSQTEHFQSSRKNILLFGTIIEDAEQRNEHTFTVQQQALLLLRSNKENEDTVRAVWPVGPPPWVAVFGTRAWPVSHWTGAVSSLYREGLTARLR